jgi:hypothetical protein
MLARLTAYPPEQAAIPRSLHPGDVLRIGRDAGNGLCLPHGSVSRQHAVLQADGARGWLLRDLGSKNGSFAGGRPVAPDAEGTALEGDCWLRFGEVYCEFSRLTPEQAARGETALRERRATAAAHTARIDAMQRLDEVLDGSLRGVIELAQCERGFVLLDGGDGLAVRASLALDSGQLAGREFSGSVGAVRRVLSRGRSIVANDVGNEPWLAARASVVAGGLQTLVCLPLLEGSHAFGAIYADRTRPGPPVTTLDMELLDAFAEHAALWIAARRASAALAHDVAAASWEGIVAAHAGEPA